MSTRVHARQLRVELPSAHLVDADEFVVGQRPEFVLGDELRRLAVVSRPVDDGLAPISKDGCVLAQRQRLANGASQQPSVDAQQPSELLGPKAVAPPNPTCPSGWAPQPLHRARSHNKGRCQTHRAQLSVSRAHRIVGAKIRKCRKVVSHTLKGTRKHHGRSTSHDRRGRKELELGEVVGDVTGDDTWWVDTGTDSELDDQ